MLNLFNDVADFNHAMGVTMRKKPGWCSDDDLTLAMALIDEEHHELLAAVTDRDMVETADAIIDSIYVDAGLANCLGIAQRADYTSVTDGAKTPTWCSDSLAATHLAVIGSAHRNLVMAVDSRDLAGTDVALHRLIFNLMQFARDLNLPTSTLWAEVHRSNMDKRTGGRVLKNKAGKVMKPQGWEPPNLTAILQVAA
ncbi:hypothetical protein [Prescottella agglutinans]|uniref:HAD superfamily Cof-like phosphohydrolase n=1 Tax=Prescottella agglutinans TaxID=1644129 RepID=A0ABT6MEV8_9NOCA|nr:hypothetical protein [Prescottella agglutinans]MDH6282856.1 putative HAD superfamily Cof-like phosphohydrolase [Prescottella agglutinans]